MNQNRTNASNPFNDGRMWEYKQQLVRVLAMKCCIDPELVADMIIGLNGVYFDTPTEKR